MSMSWAHLYHTRGEILLATEFEISAYYIFFYIPEKIRVVVNINKCGDAEKPCFKCSSLFTMVPQPPFCWVRENSCEIIIFHFYFWMFIFKYDWFKIYNILINEIRFNIWLSYINFYYIFNFFYSKYNNFHETKLYIFVTSKVFKWDPTPYDFTRLVLGDLGR